MSDAIADLQVDVAGLDAEPAVAALLEHAANLGVSDLFFTSHEHHLMVQARHCRYHRRQRNPTRAGVQAQCRMCNFPLA